MFPPQLFTLILFFLCFWSFHSSSISFRFCCCLSCSLSSYLRRCSFSTCFSSSSSILSSTIVFSFLLLLFRFPLFVSSMSSPAALSYPIFPSPSIPSSFPSPFLTPPGLLPLCQVHFLLLLLSQRIPTFPLLLFHFPVLLQHLLHFLL